MDLSKTAETFAMHEHNISSVFEPLEFEYNADYKAFYAYMPCSGQESNCSRDDFMDYYYDYDGSEFSPQLLEKVITLVVLNVILVSGLAGNSIVVM